MYAHLWMSHSYPMTVPTKLPLSTGWKSKVDFPPQCFQTRINMPDTVPRFASAYGVCVTLAILLTTGCSTVQRTPMGFADLDGFQIDCRRKGEQIAFLQSMRPTNDEKLFAGFGAMLQPWTYLSDPYAQDSRRVVSTGRSEWLINQKLMELRDNC
jgi:hypothetical protein